MGQGMSRQPVPTTKLTRAVEKIRRSIRAALDFGGLYPATRREQETLRTQPRLEPLGGPHKRLRQDWEG